MAPKKIAAQADQKKTARKVSGKSGYLAAKPGRREFAEAHIALLATRWNVELVAALLAGAQRCLHDWGVPKKQVHVFYAPGAFELPLAASELMRSGRFDGVVTLGAVIRGDTPHFEFVAGECARGLREAAQKHRVALGFGVLTVNTPEQATARAGGGNDNKGYEAAAAALEMIRLLRAIDD